MRLRLSGSFSRRYLSSVGQILVGVRAQRCIHTHSLNRVLAETRPEELYTANVYLTPHTVPMHRITNDGVTVQLTQQHYR